MYIKDHKFNVCFCPAIIGWVSPQGHHLTLTSLWSTPFWCSPQHRQSILNSKRINNPIMPYKKTGEALCTGKQLFTHGDICLDTRWNCLCCVVWCHLVETLCQQNAVHLSLIYLVLDSKHTWMCRPLQSHFKQYWVPTLVSVCKI